MPGQIFTLCCTPAALTRPIFRSETVACPAGSNPRRRVSIAFVRAFDSAPARSGEPHRAVGLARRGCRQQSDPRLSPRQATASIATRSGITSPAAAAYDVGYPASRDFQFLGCTSQFSSAWSCSSAAAGVGTLNLLDAACCRTQRNGSTSRRSIPRSSADTPRDRSDYASAILHFVAPTTRRTPSMGSRSIPETFNTTLDAGVGGTDDPHAGSARARGVGRADQQARLRSLQPNFIYQRFQRGIMHYDKACGCTQGLLLADYLKALLRARPAAPTWRRRRPAARCCSRPPRRPGARRHRVGNAFVAAFGHASSQRCWLCRRCEPGACPLRARPTPRRGRYPALTSA